MRRTMDTCRKCQSRSISNSTSFLLAMHIYLRARAKSEIILRSKRWQMQVDLKLRKSTKQTKDLSTSEASRVIRTKSVPLFTCASKYSSLSQLSNGKNCLGSHALNSKPLSISTALSSAAVKARTKQRRRKLVRS